MKSMKQGD